MCCHYTTPHQISHHVTLLADEQIGSVAFVHSGGQARKSSDASPSPLEAVAGIEPATP